MVILVIILVILVGIAVFLWIKSRKKEGKPIIGSAKPSKPEDPASLNSLEFTFLAGHWYMCLRNYYDFMKGEVYQCKYNGCLTLNGTNYRLSYPAVYFRPATEDEIPQPEPTPEPPPESPTPEPQPDPEEVVFNVYFKSLMELFGDVVTIGEDTITCSYLKDLVREAKTQFTKKESAFGLPVIYTEENFPQVYDYYGSKGSEEDALNSLCGWIVAMQLAELMPLKRTQLGKIGYEIACDRYSDIYGYKFKTDPNIARMAAGAIYAAMRGLKKPMVETMRSEIGCSGYNKTLEQLNDTKRDNVAPDAFFTDFREFMPTAPAPYAPGYTSRPDITYPTEGRDSYNNLQTDRDIHEMIVEKYNLNVMEHYQETVQAIADKEADTKHLLGKNMRTDHYQFHPVFGADTIGLELPYDGSIASLISQAFTSSSSSRGILQSANVSPKQYGRLRPGCSWSQEAKKNSSTDDRRNILTNFEIEDGDGSPTGYYDKNGNWVYKDAIKSPADFEEQQKNLLYANSYPSGHSSGIMGAAMVLIELMPDRADRILRAANQYAINRTIARYHWTSDTINGRVLGTFTNAVAHAASNYDDMLKEAGKELK